MYTIKTLNNIAPAGLAKLGPAQFKVDNEADAPQGILVRSAKMHEMELPESLLAIGRAGAGVNNIPVDKCSEAGVVVFNTPGANAGGVAELTIGGLVLASRNLLPAMEWAQGLAGEGDAVGALVEKGKSQFVGPELAGKIGRVVVARRLPLFVRRSTVVEVIMRPAASSLLKPSLVVAQGRMDGSQAGDPRVERRRYHRQGAALAGAGHAQGLAVVLRQGANKVYGTQRAHNDTVVVESIAVVPAESPIITQSPIGQIVVNRLLHGDGYAMNAYLQHNQLAGGSIGVPAIRTHAGSRHTQQGWILALGLRHRQDAVIAPAPRLGLEAYLINVVQLCAAFGQQHHGRVQRSLARLG